MNRNGIIIVSSVWIGLGLLALVAWQASKKSASNAKSDDKVAAKTATQATKMPKESPTIKESPTPKEEPPTKVEPKLNDLTNVPILSIFVDQKRNAGGGDHLTPDQRAAWEKVRVGGSMWNTVFICALTGAKDQKWMIYADEKKYEANPHWTKNPSLWAGYGDIDKIASSEANRPEVITVVFVDMFSKKDPNPFQWVVGDGKNISVSKTPKDERWNASLRQFLNHVQEHVVK